MEKFFIFLITFVVFVPVDTREVQPHDTGEKEAMGLATVKAEPGSTTGNRLLHGILSQHPQQHSLGVQNGYGRHLANHPQLGQPPYTASIATTNTPGNEFVFFIFNQKINSQFR